MRATMTMGMSMTMTSKTLSAVPGIQHGFGTRNEPVPNQLKAIWESRPSWHQVHGINIVEVSGPKVECGDTDGLFSSIPGIPLGIQTADCVPILLSRRDGQKIAAVHAGWKGTKARILRQLWRALGAQNEQPQDWVAAVGPAIGPCCFEVSKELAKSFTDEFKAFDSKLVAPSFRHLDLQAINVAELSSLGFYEVDRITACTRCSKIPDFFSYRRDGSGHRQYSVISIL